MITMYWYWEGVVVQKELNTEYNTGCSLCIYISLCTKGIGMPYSLLVLYSMFLLFIWTSICSLVLYSAAYMSINSLKLLLLCTVFCFFILSWIYNSTIIKVCCMWQAFYITTCPAFITWMLYDLSLCSSDPCPTTVSSVPRLPSSLCTATIDPVGTVGTCKESLQVSLFLSACCCLFHQGITMIMMMIKW